MMISDSLRLKLDTSDLPEGLRECTKYSDSDSGKNSSLTSSDYDSESVKATNVNKFPPQLSLLLILQRSWKFTLRTRFRPYHESRVF